MSVNQARITVLRDDVELGRFDSRPNTVVPDPNRGQFNDSVNYYVPVGWRSGTVEFRVEVNPDREIPEPDFTDNVISKEVTFHSVPPLCVEMVPVPTEPQTASVDDPGFWSIIGWVEAAYPVPGLRVIEGRPLQMKTIAICEREGEPRPCVIGPYEMPADSSKVLGLLAHRALASDPPDGCQSMFQYGMVHSSAAPTGNGAALIPGNVAWGVMDLTDWGSGAAWSMPDGGYIMAHELGHILGRGHVDCNVPPDDLYIDDEYPYNNCDLGPVNNPTAYYGFDVPDGAVIPPTEAADFMSYVLPSWTSDYTYRALFDRLSPTISARASLSTPEALTQAQELLVALGIITPTEGTVALDPFYRQPQGSLSSSKVARAAARQAVTSDEEAYHLVLLDSTDTVLIDQPFQLPRIFDDTGPTRPFLVVMSYDPDTARIVLMRDATELASRAVSSHAPSVQLLTPNGGETINDTLTIQWESQDEDGDRLFYTVQYSPDLGATWRALAINYLNTTLTLDTDALPGSQGRSLIRVTATDWINTGIDQSDGPFTLQSHPPRTYITAPADGAVFDHGSQIIFIGRTIDAEDITVVDENLVWRSDWGGLLGTGRDLLVTDLSPGWHTITLEATDSDGQTGTDSMRIFISTARVYLPLISGLSVPTALSSPTPVLAQPARAYRFEWR